MRKKTERMFWVRINVLSDDTLTYDVMASDVHGNSTIVLWECTSHSDAEKLLRALYNACAFF